MRKAKSVRQLEDLGRVRLSRSFFMRDFLYSEIAHMHGLMNVPDDPDLAIAAGTRLCEDLLEPLNETFGRVTIRSAFRSCEVNGFGNEMQKQGKSGYGCASNEANHARHIWDRRDADGCMGATACIVIPWFVERYDAGADWRALAWWIHDRLPAYSEMCFYPRLCALNLNWHEKPKHRIESWIGGPGKRCLTRPGMDNGRGDHSESYPGFPELRR